MAFFHGVEEELQAIKDRELAQQATAARTGSVWDGIRGVFHPQQDNSALVDNLAGYQKKYFWLAPGVQYALAKGGFHPDSETAKTTATTGAQVAMDNMDFQPPGTPVKAGLLSKLVGTNIDQMQADFAAVHAQEAQGIYPHRVSPSSPIESLFGMKSAVKGLGMQKTAWDNLPASVRQELSGLSVTQIDPSELPGYNPNDVTHAPIQAVYKVDGAENLSDAARLAVHKVVFGNGGGVQGPWVAKQAAQVTGNDPRNFLIMGGQHIETADNNQLGPVGGSIGGMTQVSGLVPTKQVSTALNATVRGGTMALNAPIQEVQGQVGNFYSLAHGGNPNPLESQSDLGVAIDDIIHGQPAYTGEGMFLDPNATGPNGEPGVAQQRRARQLERGNIGGHTITPGRWAADLFFEPDTKPFNLLSGSVDLAVALKGDPSNIALSKFSEIRAGDKMFTEAGGLLGLERTVSNDAVEKWAMGADGEKVFDYLAGKNKTRDVMQALKGKGDPATWAAIADTRTADEVRDVMMPKLGTEFINKPTVPTNAVTGAIGGTTARSRDSIRLLNTMPGKFVDLEDPHQAVTQVENWLQNAKAPTGVIDDFVDRMARAPDRFSRYNVLNDMMGSTKGILVQKYGVEPGLAHDLTTMFTTAQNKFRQDFVDEIGNTVDPWTSKANIGGTVVDTPSPHLLSEHINRMVPLPDPRAIRRVTSNLKIAGKALVSTPEGEQRLPLATAQALQDEIWKPMQLLRGAWTLRVVGEEQIRMGAAGLDSLFRHPLSAISWIAGRKRSEDLLGNTWQDVVEHQQAMSHGAMGLLETPGKKVLNGDWVIANKTEEEMSSYMRGWATELAQLHGDPVASNVARFDNLADAKDWFMDGAGQKFRQQLIGAGHTELDTPQAASDYIDSVAHRIAIKTGGNEDLLNAVRTGNVEDVPLADLAAVGVNKQVISRLEAHLDDGPDAVKVQRLVRDASPGVKDKWDRGVQSMFGFLMAKPTNWLSRSSTFRQAYWDRVSTLTPFMSEEGRAAALQAAEEANIPSAALKKISKASASTGDLTFDVADQYAKGHALDFTRNLLYDMSERSQFFDAMRLIAPFGEAWKEVLGRWARLFTERPQNLRRLQQGIEGARGADFGGMVGSPTGNGFFYKNDRGEEVFVYPGSQWLTSKFTGGVPIPLTGRVSGLNMLGNIFPSIGPVAQIPAAYFVPDKPEYDSLNSLLFPYGRPQLTTSGVAEAWLPAWAKRIMSPEYNDSPDSVRTYANSVMDVARYLASTGDYDLSTEDGQSKLLSDAKEKAGQFNTVRAVAQFFSPSSPSPDWLVKDKDGNLLQTSVMANEFRNMQNEDYDNAAQNFLNKYGPNSFLVMQSKTQAVSFGYPVNSDGLAWMRDHPEMEKKYPNVFGYFAPQTGEFDYNAYVRSINTGAKKPLSPEQFLALGEAKLGSYQYSEARTKVDQMSGGKPSDQQRAILRQLQDALIKQYPGYGESLEGRLGLTERASPQGKIDEISKAMKNPVLAATDAGQATITYLQARDTVSKRYVEQTGGAPDGWKQANAARQQRDILRVLGAALVKEHPQFAPVFEQVFDREMNDDAVAQAGG